MPEKLDQDNSPEASQGILASAANIVRRGYEARCLEDLSATVKAIESKPRDKGIPLATQGINDGIESLVVNWRGPNDYILVRDTHREGSLGRMVQFFEVLEVTEDAKGKPQAVLTYAAYSDMLDARGPHAVKVGRAGAKTIKGFNRNLAETARRGRFYSAKLGAYPLDPYELLAKAYQIVPSVLEGDYQVEAAPDGSRYYHR